MILSTSQQRDLRAIFAVLIASLFFIGCVLLVLRGAHAEGLPPMDDFAPLTDTLLEERGASAPIAQSETAVAAMGA